MSCTIVPVADILQPPEQVLMAWECKSQGLVNWQILHDSVHLLYMQRKSASFAVCTEAAGLPQD